jgi:gliding motility-associated protein GldC
MESNIQTNKSKPMTKSKTSDIIISVSLNEEKHPVAIQWHAEDSGTEGLRNSKAVMLSLFDQKEQTTMRIDLWTMEMMVEEMQLFFYETMASMADTYERATNDKDLSAEMRAFAKNFGTKTKVIK